MTTRVSPYLDQPVRTLQQALRDLAANPLYWSNRLDESHAERCKQQALALEGTPHWLRKIWDSETGELHLTTDADAGT